MRDNDHLVRILCLAQHQVDQIVHANGGGLNIEPVRGYMAMQRGVHAFEESMMRLRHECRGSLIIEPVHPDACGRQ